MLLVWTNLIGELGWIARTEYYDISCSSYSKFLQAKKEKTTPRLVHRKLKLDISEYFNKLLPET